MKTKRSRLLIIAIAEKLAEKEREMVQVRLVVVGLQVKVQLLESFHAKRRMVIVVLSSLSVDQTAVNCGFCDN